MYATCKYSHIYYTQYQFYIYIHNIIHCKTTCSCCGVFHGTYQEYQLAQQRLLSCSSSQWANFFPGVPQCLSLIGPCLQPKFKHGLSWDCPKCVASLGKKSSLLDWFLSSLGKKSELAKGRVPRQLDLCHSFIQYEKRIFEIAWHFHLSQRSRSASTWWRQSRSLRQPNPRRDITDKWHGLPIWPFSEQVCEFQKEMDLG